MENSADTAQFPGNRASLSEDGDDDDALFRKSFETPLWETNALFGFDITSGSEDGSNNGLSGLSFGSSETTRERSTDDEVGASFDVGDLLPFEMRCSGGDHTGNSKRDRDDDNDEGQLPADGADDLTLVEEVDADTAEKLDFHGEFPVFRSAKRKQYVVLTTHLRLFAAPLHLRCMCPGVDDHVLEQFISENMSRWSGWFKPGVNGVFKPEISNGWGARMECQQKRGKFRTNCTTYCNGQVAKAMDLETALRWARDTRTREKKTFKAAAKELEQRMKGL